MTYNAGSLLWAESGRPLEIVRSLGSCPWQSEVRLHFESGGRITVGMPVWIMPRKKNA